MLQLKQSNYGNVIGGICLITVTRLIRILFKCTHGFNLDMFTESLIIINCNLFNVCYGCVDRVPYFSYLAKSFLVLTIATSNNIIAGNGRILS